jgi:hypothetical protein
MKSIIITTAALLSLSSGAFAWENSSKTVYGDAAPVSTATGMTGQGSAAISAPAADSGFVQTMRDR